MRKFCARIVLCCLLLSVGIFSTSVFAQGKSKTRISADLQQLIPGMPQAAGSSELADAKAYLFHENMVAINAVAEASDGVALLKELEQHGLKLGSSYGKVVSGYMAFPDLGKLENIKALRFATPAYAPIKHAGVTATQGDRSMLADVSRTQYGVTGKGSKVGILSDSYNARGGAAAGVASGDLPANVQILQDLTGPTLIDEGRAMVEIVHDVAPGADIAFHTAFTGPAGFANGIRRLAEAGCNIIVDDVFYLNEPFYQDGIIAQAVNEVAKNKVAYFSAAGNHRDDSYEAPFANSGLTLPGYGQVHDFGAGDWRQTVTIAGRQTLNITLQWDDPFFSVTGGRGTATDLDLLVVFNGTILTSLSGLSDNVASGDPIEIIGLRNNGLSPLNIELVIVKYAGPDPANIKWVNFGNGSFPPFIEHLTNSSTLVGHANAENGMAVGASAWFNTPVWNANVSAPVINNFSSLGGTAVYIMPDGKRTGAGEGKTRRKPDFVGPDGGNTTFFGSDSPFDADAYPNFFGTSAAAPHAAAVAALMQEVANNQLNPERIRTIMVNSALDMDNPATPTFDAGFDYRTGHGFIQADYCVNQAGGKLIATAPLSKAVAGEMMLAAYPNPVRGNLMVNGRGNGRTNGTVTVTDFAGRRIMSLQVPSGAWQRTINTAAFGGGMYLLQYTSGNEVRSSKVLVQQ